MTRTVSPMQLLFCIKQTFFVFILQTLIAYYFVFEDLDFNNFQPFTMKQSVIRLIASMLLQITASEELSNAIKVLTFLKRQKVKKQYMQSRYINILIASLHVLTPLSLFTSLVLTLGQTGQFSLIIKNYVTLGFMMTIDNIFTSSLPKEVIQNAQKLNKSGLLKMGPDANTFAALYKRAKRADRDVDEYFIVFMSSLVNLWYFFIQSFQVIVYNYFGAYMCLVAQYVGYRYQVAQEL
uniref:Uncharacterized protein n=1 Tax=Strombidium rassoulzadegani TaxID=1082188 RepID=A0A7S3CIN0_9SPIT|mmetsp:Transcript_12020/g.20292  ORF Transcript_12020/g.20292 Transcript_12020/m.20292 type:complete len:237 (+) Transcript_12020:1-711(+)